MSRTRTEVKGRNPFAVAAFERKASKFRHKNEPRGGARNEQRELAAMKSGRKRRKPLFASRAAKRC
jgi:hypothetical protein